MSCELGIRNIGGITQADISFSGRFIAITGESGAGKSSVVRALELLTGSRSAAGVLHAGTEQGEVCLALEPLSGNPTVTSDEPVLVRRIISASGKNRTYIQDRPATLSTLEQLMKQYVRIQSQFAQIQLLNPNDQMAILDASGGQSLQLLKNDLVSLWTKAVALERRIREIQKRRAEIEKIYAAAEKILPVLSSLNLSPGCETEWETTRLELQERVRTMRHASEYIFRLAGGKSEPGLIDELERTVRSLCSLFPEDKAREFVAAFDEGIPFMRTAVRYAEQEFGSRELDVAEAALEEHERRLGALRKVMRQLNRNTAESLLEYARTATSELSWLSSSVGEMSSLNDEVLDLKKNTSKAALALREERRRKAKEIGAKISATLHELAMPGTVFRIDVEPQERIRSTGADMVSFMFSSDGERFLPVQKVASGGELSRLLLAVQVVMPESLLPDTLVFDEVEAGLGGQAALLTGLRLRDLSRSCRIILITHEATLAALADQHFLVERIGSETDIREVYGEERICEIARMLSGDPNMREAQDHARKILLGERPGLQQKNGSLN